MSKKRIEKNLIKALLHGGKLEKALYDYELAEHVDEYLLSKKQDKDKYFFAITEHSNDVAMLLIDEDDVVHINEAARERLQLLWQEVYGENMQRLIPDMAGQLEAGFLYAAGVKVVEKVKYLDLSSIFKNIRKRQNSSTNKSI
ncbi:MAG: PAS domain-containing protein [Chloroflexi bacterium]|nr:MAG: PAS domain-containing protein [Chloroflexota bacterium]